MSRPALPPKKLTLWNAVVMVQDTGTYTKEVPNQLGYTRAIFRVTTATEVGTATFDFKVQAYNDLTATWFDIPGASLAQQTSATSATDLVIGVGLTAVANRVVSQPVPRRMRAHITIGDATLDGYTVTVECELLP